MKGALRVVAALALLATIAPAVMFYAGALGHEAMNAWMAAATVAWFASAPSWMGRGPR